MKIRVAQRFRPYSKTPGAAHLIPGEETIIQAFSSKSLKKDLSGQVLSEEPGQSLLTQNLEKPFKPERLSFGCNKHQDVDLIRRRQDLKEILPIWFKLATYYPESYEVKPGSLLYQLVNEKDRNLLSNLFLKTYLAGFNSFFVPRSIDTDFYGFDLPPLTDEPLLALVTEGAKAIKKMFVDLEGETVLVLPNMPSDFSCGRVIETPIGKGVISIEWTKHFLRQVIYTSVEDEEVSIRFPKEVKSYRVKAIGKSFYFDNFMA